MSDIAYIQPETDPGLLYVIFGRLLELLEPATLDDGGVRDALRRRLPDIVDGFQLEAALNWKASHLITRNLRDFPGNAPLRIMTPAGYLRQRTD